jgi:uncharacterized membrane protein YhaH (DUF805 family)
MSLVGLFNLWINLALIAKRLHDRDRTGWWLAVQFVAIAVAVLLAVLTLSLPKDQRQPLESLAVLVVIAVFTLVLWLFGEIGFLRGRPGPNRFGPDPLATGKADDQR